VEIYLKAITSGKPIWDYDFLICPVRNNGPLGLGSRYGGTEISNGVYSDVMVSVSVGSYSDYFKA
jgi:hypothetical protein